MMQDYLDLVIRLADLPASAQALEVRALPHVTVAHLINEIRDEMSEELTREIGETKTKKGAFALWFDKGISPLPALRTLEELQLVPFSRLVFGQEMAVVPQRPWNPTLQRRLEAEPPGESEPGVVLIEGTSRKRILFGETPVVFGREGERSTPFRRINLDEFNGAQFVSKEHLLLFRKDEHYYLVDLGAQNGTFLNNEPLTPRERAYPIQHGDVIFLGNRTQHIVLTFHRP